MKKYVSYLIQFLPLSILILVVLFLIKNKDAVVSRIINQLFPCDGCMIATIISFESIFFSTIFLLFSITLFFNNYILKTFIKLSILIILIGFYIDVQILDQFFTRFNLGHINQYANDVSLLIRHVENTGFYELDFKLTSIVFISLIIFIFFNIKANKYVKAISLFIPLIMTFSLIYNKPTSYVHNWMMKNYIESNFVIGVDDQYSSKYKEKFIEKDLDKNNQICSVTSENNIILLILESWSPYQSKYFSGINDWTPNIDSLAKSYTSYKNMYAGGFTTNEGLMSILSGVEFLSPTKGFFSVTPFETAWGFENTVPKIFNKAGYKTFFLTNGNLDFSYKKKWLNHIGYTSLEGHDHPEYNGKNRLHFDAVADEYLYKRAINLIKEQEDPYFITLENVSTHHPYIHPITKEKSEEKVFRYMDDTVYLFYKNLQALNFFNKGGTLILISDHRAMVPISKLEHDLFGRSAASKIPAIVISKNDEKLERTDMFHQSDIITSFANCADKQKRSIFSSDNEEKCHYHARGDDRDIIDFFCENGEGYVRLAGDDTRIGDSTGISDSQKKEVLNDVNKIRIIGDYRTELYKSSLEK